MCLTGSMMPRNLNNFPHLVLSSRRKILDQISSINSTGAQTCWRGQDVVAGLRGSGGDSDPVELAGPETARRRRSGGPLHRPSGSCHITDAMFDRLAMS